MVETVTRRVTRSVSPTTEPLSLAEAKLYLRVDGAEEDALISDMIVAVREAAETHLGKSLITQSWMLAYEGYVPSHVPLPKGPVQSIAHVKTRTRSGVETAINATLYHLAVAEDAVHFESVLMAHAVEITYTTGYGDAEDVPASVRQGMLMHLAALYDNRLGGMELPAAVVTLYKPHRVVRL